MLELRNLLSRDQLIKEMPVLKGHMLSHWLQKNVEGFRDACVFKVGKRVFFDRAAVETWIERLRACSQRHGEGYAEPTALA